MAQGDPPPPPFGDFDERLRRARGGAGRGGEPAGPGPRPMRAGQGFQAGVEVVAGVGGGALLGYGLDRWLGTAPFLFILFFMLGAAAGVLNAYRTLRRHTGAAAPPGGGGAGGGDRGSAAAGDPAAGPRQRG